MKILNGTIDGRARESRHTGDEGNTSSPQLFGIDGSDKVLLSLIQVGEQRSVFLLQFFLFAHTVSITWGASFVTIIILQALTRTRLDFHLPLLVCHVGRKHGREEHSRIEEFIDCLREHKESVEFLDLTLEKLLKVLILPPQDEPIFVEMMTEQLGLSSMQDRIAERL